MYFKDQEHNQFW